MDTSGVVLKVIPVAAQQTPTGIFVYLVDLQPHEVEIGKPARQKPGELGLAAALLGLWLLLEDEGVSLIGNLGENGQVVAAEAFGLFAVGPKLRTFNNRSWWSPNAQAIVGFSLQPRRESQWASGAVTLVHASILATNY